MAGVGLTIAEMETIISNLFNVTLFGSSYLVGIFIVLVVGWWIARHGKSTGSLMLISLAVLVIWLGGTSLYVFTGDIWSGGYLPPWASGAVIMIMLTLFGVGFYKFTKDN